MTQSAARRLRGLLVDLDGVVYIGDRPTPGAVEFFAALRRHGMPFQLTTNNSTRTPRENVDKLARMGIAVSEDEVLSSALATAVYLAQMARSGADVFVVGEEGLRSAIEQQGFRLVEQRPELVVVGLDRAFDYRKLTLAVRGVSSGARLIAANPDPSLPTEDGDLPGAGCLCAAITAATGVAPLIVGKPEPTMFLLAAQRLGLQASQVGVLGDRLDTDIVGAKRSGMLAILVLTGVTSHTDLERSAVQPDLVVEDLPQAATMLFEHPGLPSEPRA